MNGKKARMIRKMTETNVSVNKGYTADPRVGKETIKTTFEYKPEVLESGEVKFTLVPTEITMTTVVNASKYKYRRAKKVFNTIPRNKR